MTGPRHSPAAGFISAQVGMLAAVIALVLTGILAFVLQVRGTADSRALSEEVALEEQRLVATIKAMVRQNLRNNEVRVFNGINVAAVAPYVSTDPRYSGLSNNVPGFLPTSLDVPGTPALLSATPVFQTPPGSSPFDALRQVQYVCPIAYVLSRRYSPAGAATNLVTRQGTVSVTLREIPITQFALLAFEDLSADSGFSFAGMSYVAGSCVANSSTFTMRVSPNTIPDAQLSSGEQVWEQGGMAVSLLTAPTSLTDPTASAPQLQNIARKGQTIYFDGAHLSSDGTLPAAIAVATDRGATRVVIDLQALPQSNVAIDSALGTGAGNVCSAYYIACTTPLARDRGVVVRGTSVARLCDVVATNGVLTLFGSHTGGPLLAASGAGGAFFENTADVTWNTVLVLPSPSPYVSATTAAAAPAGARHLLLSAGSAPLSAGEMGYDSVAVRATPTSGAFLCGFGTDALGGPQVWIDATATTFRIGVATTAGPVYSASLARGSGQVELTLSRSQNAVRLLYSGGVAYYSLSDLTADRPRVETRSAYWSGGLSQIDVVTSAAGTVLGAAQPGSTVHLRTLLSLGTLTRFGSARFQFTPSGNGDALECVAPRVLVLDR